MSLDPSKMTPEELALIYPMPSGDPSLTTKVIASIWVMASISTIFLSLRLYCRASNVGKLWWDDFLLIVGWIFLIVSVGLQTEIFRLGYLVTSLAGGMIGPLNLSSDSCMKLALAFVKTSFALTVLRIAIGWPRYVIYVAAFIMNVTMVVHAVLVWRANCEVQQDYTFQSCWSSESGIWMNMVGSIISAITDFILALVPLHIIMGLQMKRVEKIGVAVAMSIGIFAGAVSIVKAVESHGVVKVKGPAFSHRLANLSLWIHAEPNAAIVASSIPVLRILFRDVVNKYGTPNGVSGQYIKSNQQSTFHGGVASSSAAVTAVKGDDSSETSILAQQQQHPEKVHQLHPQSRIQQTRQITIEYDTAGSLDHSTPGNWRSEGIELGTYTQKSSHGPR
ncbi:hypothetical protein B0H66DRAFT_297192 [Apodospora peruviana]|uniref:Rhodopsin domain-containing protein n=1 Tax=Apodospora peruviana TaxID=516989 RepID=A0AAE0I0V9_9PEZI|nr:hypothetical protein B0H66DRAFT_297192 [Apodospora peruviana]